MKFKFKWVDRATPDGVWETHNENKVTDKETAATLVAEWIKAFNEVELMRYGGNGKPRTVVDIQIVGEGPRRHEFEKSNSMTIGGDGHAPRDRWVCKVCGCVGLRYGVSGTIKRTGAWSAKKYEFCIP